MQAKTQLRILYGLLFLVLLITCLSFFFLMPTGEDEFSGGEGCYDYDEVQTLVTIPLVTLEEGPQPPSYDADELRSYNNDFQGWLNIPETSIDFPVVQGKDNSYYLTHSFTKKYSQFGCLFLEKDAEADDRSRVIHGHNMGINREEMFSTLVNFQDPDYAEDHKIIFYSDPDRPGAETYTLFAVLNLNIKNKDGFNYRQRQFETDEEFAEFVSYLQSNSLYFGDYTPTGEIIILSTCNRAYGNDNRLLICAGREKKE